MIKKVYLVLGHNDGGSEGWGDYVSLYGVYVDKYEARERMLELTKEVMGTRDATDMTDTRETFEVKTVEFNQNIDECLGGYAEWKKLDQIITRAEDKKPLM